MSDKAFRWDKGLDVPLPSGPASINKEEDIGIQQKNVKERHEWFAQELRKQAIGPVPMNQFLNRVLPNPPSKRKGKKRSFRLTMKKGARKVVDDFACVPKKANNHEELCQPLCEALRPFFTNHTLVDTHLHTEFSSARALKPDLCLYSNEVVDQLRVKGNEFIANFGFAGVIFIVRKDVEYDPFRDPDRNSRTDHVFIPNDSDHRENVNKALGQIGTYVTALFARQYRTHCFTVSIYGPTARIIRWDRAGAIVSRAFNYHKQPHWLKEFARRYSQASDAQRGYDMTVMRASEEEEDIFVSVVKRHVKEQLHTESEEELEKCVEDHYKKDRVYKLSIWPQPPPERAIPGECSDPTTDTAPSSIKAVPKTKAHHEEEEETSRSESDTSSGQDNVSTKGTVEAKTHECHEDSPTHPALSISRKYTTTQYFLVSRPVIAPTSTVTGRSTRGHWAVKLPDALAGETECSVCFLKDSWRRDSKSMKMEGEIMVGLVEDGVRYISDIFCHGDLKSAEYHETESDKETWDLWDHNENASKYSYIHYRVAFVEVGYPLYTLLGTKELMHAWLTVFYAVSDAYKKSKTLHRDISISNIILVRRDDEVRIGILIDWEFSSSCDADGISHRISRGGTWAFMSIRALQGRDGFKHELQDDMESLFYVVLYGAIRWLPHNKIEQLGEQMSAYFNEQHRYRGYLQGGDVKMANRAFRDAFSGNFEWECKHLEDWIENCLVIHHSSTRDDLQGMPWTPEYMLERLLEIWAIVGDKDLPKGDRVVHDITIKLDDVDTYQTSAYNPSRLGPHDSLSTKQPGSVAQVASHMCDSLGKRKTKHLAGSEKLGPKRDKKRIHLDEDVEVGGKSESEGNSKRT